MLLLDSMRRCLLPDDRLEPAWLVVVRSPELA
jgi:hypothetical protein